MAFPEEDNGQDLTYEEKLQNLREFDLEPVNAQLRHDGYENVEEMEAKFRRFAKAVLDNPEDSLSPRPRVDEYWHKLILDTKRYMQFCDQVFGNYLHHVPEIPNEGNHNHKHDAPNVE